MPSNNMTQKSWMTWVLLVGLLWIWPNCTTYGHQKSQQIAELRDCFSKKSSQQQMFLVADNFTGLIKKHLQFDSCILFLKLNRTEPRVFRIPELVNTSGSLLLFLFKWHIEREKDLGVLMGPRCNQTVQQHKSGEGFNHTVTGTCQATFMNTGTACKQSTYDENTCKKMYPQAKNKYIVNLTETETNCYNCVNPVKSPEKTIELDAKVNVNEGERLDPAQAVQVMNSIANLVTSIEESSVSLSAGDDITGVLVKETDPADVDEVSFAYSSGNDSMNIIDNKNHLPQFSRSVTVPKEAFEKATSLNVSVPFVAVVRFHNMARDELNSTILGNEVLAIEMGVPISNLTDKISIYFGDMKYQGVPSCQSWNSEGRRPIWTDNGCKTIADGNNITCLCSHLTFFAILLAPLNQTIPSSDLNKLTVITQIGCGLSMFFLVIVLFMHFLIRNYKTSTILIQLILAIFFLNFTFLTNNFVANLKNSVGCKIMAALMHYFMLATFTWFAVQAFHICLQLHTGGENLIRHYVLKVSVTSWVLPGIVVIALLIAKKYGEQVIYTDNNENNVAMCWITDNNVHYIVNIGYYALVFLFTFTTFIVTVLWLFCLGRVKTSNIHINATGINIAAILGLCCMLGITWGFAFFAYGALTIPSYYIFTTLNSFQGFFLFIYYYKSRRSGETSGGLKEDSNSNSRTLETSQDKHENSTSTR